MIKENREEKSLINKNSIDIQTDFFIPEPTRSLLWLTNDDISDISSPLSIKLNIRLSEDGIKATINDKEGNFYEEPSLIWTKLPVENNSDIETKPMYYPSYTGLSPKNRYQYLNWLRDIAKETNLSYVFLYYYGLERHLLIGNYDGAVDEVLRLLKFQNKGTFKGYVTAALLVASIFRKRVDIFEKAPFLFNEISNEALLIRLRVGEHLNVEDIIDLSTSVGFKNKRYLKTQPEKFKVILEEVFDDFQKKHGYIFDLIDPNNLEKEESIIFANCSIPRKIRQIKVPQIIKDEKFKILINDLLFQTHQRLKVENRKKN